MPRKRAQPRRKAPERIPVGPAPRGKYADRPRDTPYMLWIKSLPCCARTLPHDVGPCTGPVEADHAGARGLSRKADDATVIPLCVRHHREPGLGAILHGRLARGELRAWKDRLIARLRDDWENVKTPADRLYWHGVADSRRRAA